MDRKVVSMESKLAAALAAVGSNRVTVTSVCENLQISRQSYYKYRKRFRLEGPPGLVERSRRPGSSPSAVGEEMVSRIVAVRALLAEEGWDNGATSIYYRLLAEGVQPPTRRTIHRVLVRAGLVESQPAKRPRSSFKRFEHPAPNACWQLDGTEWALADQSEACILRLTDDHARMILASRAAPAENTLEAWALVETALARHGRPVMLLSDGGSAFTSRRTTGGISVFEQRLREQGINPVVSSPRHPQTCGKKERDWQPLKRWLAAHPPAATLAELQSLLDAYDVLFNTDRPHQGINGATPAERYAASAKAVPAPGPLAPPLSHSERQVRASGRVDLGNRFSVGLGHEWTGAKVTVVRDDLDVAILHEGQLIKRLTIDTSRKSQNSGLKRGRPPKALVSEQS